MKTPDMRGYLPKDFEEVKSLIEEGGLNAPGRPEELNGVGIIAKDEAYQGEGDPPIIGFIWALTAPGVPVAYVNHFVVVEKFKKSNVGVWLGKVLLMFLGRVGVSKVIFNCPTWNRSFHSAMMARGAKDLGIHHVLVAELGGEEAQNGTGNQYADADSAA